MPAEAAPVEAFCPQRIHLVGELNEGTIDHDELLAGLNRLATELGAEKMRWRMSVQKGPTRAKILPYPGRTSDRLKGRAAKNNF
jgi:hypothetical protein